MSTSMVRPPMTILMPYKKNNSSTPMPCMNEGKVNLIKFKLFTSKEKEIWLKTGLEYGFIRVYDTNGKRTGTPSVVVPCTLDTTCKQICEKLVLGIHELHITLNGDTVRRLDPEDKPLLIQNAYFSNIGITDLKRQQECGDSLDLCFLIKFSAGRPVINDELGRSTLTCYCHVRKGRVFHNWTKRLCVLNSARLLIYPDLDRSGTPDIIALSRAKVEDAHLRSKGRCIKITVAAPRRPVQNYYIAFDSAVDLNTWLNRCLKGSAKIPPISDLSNLQLEYLPEQVFCIGSERLLTQLNLRRNCLKTRPSNETSLIVGWLDDLARLESLRSLNLADNDLRQCPSALCQLTALTELILSGNKLNELPAGIKKLCNLQTLNLQNNWLSRLPLELSECQSLCNIDLSFNRFIKIPEILNKLPLLEQWILNGNDIERLVDESVIKNANGIKKIELRRCKLVSNALTSIPVGLLPLLTHLDIRDNRCLTSLRSEELAFITDLRSLVIMPVPKNLKIFDVSRNNLNKLPEWLTELAKIEKIIASHNRLTNLPQRIFTNVSSMKTLVLNHNNIAIIPNQVENCFIEFLDLHHNKLTHLPPEFLASAHKLRSLNLSENLLTTLPPLNPFLDLNKVQQLYLACNRLSDDVIPIISGYRRLRVLDLAYNVIRNVDESCIEKLQLLESINLSGNRLLRLPSSLADLPNLAVLRAHSNRLISLPDFSRAPCLKVLDCGSNQLETIDVRHLLSPQLKHLDVSCNPKLRLDTTAFQQFRSERLVSLIDMSRESRRSTISQSIDHTKQSITNQRDILEKPPWQTGFSETSGERNKLCVVQIRCPIFRKEGIKNGALFGIVDGGLNSELPQQLLTKFPEVLYMERQRDPTTDDYLKYTILTAHQGLQTSGQKMGASCTLCHIEETETSSNEDNTKKKVFTLRVANVGHTEAVLCRKGKAIMLTRRFLMEDASIEEIERIRKAGAIITEENEINGITPCSRLLGCNFLYPAVIPWPHVSSVQLQANDEFLLIASRGLWEMMDQTEAIRRIRRITNPILAAKHLQDVAQAYGFKENLSILVVRFQFNPISKRDSDCVIPRPLATAPMSSTNHRGPALVAAMSAMNIMDSDEDYSTSDEDVKSEPRDAKLIRDPPNYYFEYKKQLKQLMLEAGSSDGFSMHGPESLYSVATLVCDDPNEKEHEGDLDAVSSYSFDRQGIEEVFRFDDGYQSSEMATPKPVLVDFDQVNRSIDFDHINRSMDFDNGGYATIFNGGIVDNPAITHDLIDIHEDVGSSANSSCSSGLGKSSSTSPDQHPTNCENKEKHVPRWLIDDQEVLKDSKERFQQARQFIVSKLKNETNNDQRIPQAHVARMCILGDEKVPVFKKVEHHRKNRSIDNHDIDLEISSDTIYETPSSHFSHGQSIYEVISHDDAELDDDYTSTNGQKWNYSTSSHSDDQIQCSGSWKSSQLDEQGGNLKTNQVEQRLVSKPGFPVMKNRRHPTLIVANIDIDGNGPQNVIISDKHAHKLM